MTVDALPVSDSGPGEGGKADIFGDLVECDDGACLRDRDAVELVIEYNEELSEEERELKFCKMAESAFVFYRGSNHLFWRDLGLDPRLMFFGETQGDWATRIWLQGDLHAENYGVFDNDEADVVYDLNDFDEALIADYQLDLWRMATSLVLIAAVDSDYDGDDVEEIIDAFAEAYLDTVASFRGNDDELDAVVTESSAYGRLDNFLRDVEEESSRLEMLERLTLPVEDEWVFDLSNKNLELADGVVATEIVDAMEAYQATLTGGIAPSDEYFWVKDVVRRINTGTGSLGTPRYYVLIEGETESPDDDRILDVKRQGPPTPYAFLGPSPELEGLSNNAQRAVLGYQALASDADDHLGWMELFDGFYSVRERSPYKEAFPLDELTSIERFVEMAEQWGEILAAAHSRADQDFDESIVGYSFDRNVDELTDGNHAEFRHLLLTVAAEYAIQVTADHEVFRAFVDPESTCP